MSHRTSIRTSLLARIGRRLTVEWCDIVDRARVGVISALDRWPCTDRKYLLVGSESSGTSTVADLLFEGIPGIRFLREGGKHAWVWEAYRQIYQGEACIRDYPRLQLFDAIKVPGFAMIIDQFRTGFPNSTVVYMVRDPRDFVSSAFRTWSAQGIEDPSQIPWVAEDWLGISNTDPVERLCVRWKSYLLSGSSASDVIFLRYEDFYVDKAGTIRDLAVRLGLPFNEGRVAERKNEQVSSYRNYVPRGPGSWKDSLSEEHVRTIERLCEEEMTHWGYPLRTD